MIPGINIPSNKEKIAIVVVGYNRIKPLQRLLGSLVEANYPPPKCDIPLVISIDASGDEALYEYVRRFQWPHGTKYVNIQEERLGLKNHIFQCGDLTSYFRAIILLEDDLFVAPYFYSYTQQAVEAYGEDERIAEIALYGCYLNDFVGMPFTPLNNGADVYLMRKVVSWGQCWTTSMWKRFVQWRNIHNHNMHEVIQNAAIPNVVKTWSRAWSPYFMAYMAYNHLYTVLPYNGHSTCFGDIGEHVVTASQTSSHCILQMGDKRYDMRPLDELVRYDINFCNEALYQYLGLNEEDTCLDIYGMQSVGSRKYLLSSLDLPYKKIRTFSLVMKPIELNVINGIEGDGLFLYEVESSTTSSCITAKLSKSLMRYFWNQYSWKYWLQLGVSGLFKAVIFKIKHLILHKS